MKQIHTYIQESIYYYRFSVTDTSSSTKYLNNFENIYVYLRSGLNYKNLTNLTIKPQITY